MWKVSVGNKINKTQLLRMVENGFYRLNYNPKKDKITIGKVKSAVLLRATITNPRCKVWALIAGKTYYRPGAKYLIPFAINKIIFEDRKKATAVAKKINESGDVCKAWTDLGIEVNDKYYSYRRTETRYAKHEDEDAFGDAEPVGPAPKAKPLIIWDELPF